MSQVMEEELRKPVHEFFEKKNYHVFDEVKLFSRKIDVVAKRRSETIAVELKLRDWRKAIQQAYLDLRVSDYSIVALPETMWGRINREIYCEAYYYGIGLLSVDGVARQIMRPERSRRIQHNLRRNFLKTLSGDCP